jgi:hypothetical protein
MSEPLPAEEIQIPEHQTNSVLNKPDPMDQKREAKK